MPEMTVEVLRSIAEANKGYRTPGLNDVLYLHYKVSHAASQRPTIRSHSRIPIVCEE